MIHTRKHAQNTRISMLKNDLQINCEHRSGTHLPRSPVKETKMFKNRFLLVLGSLALVSLAISSFRSNTSLSNREAASDFVQRHPNWTWLAPASAGAYS